MVIESIRGQKFEFLYTKYRFDTVWKVPSFVRKYQDASSFVRLASKATLTQPSALPLGSKKESPFRSILTQSSRDSRISLLRGAREKKNFDGHSITFPFTYTGNVVIILSVKIIRNQKKSNQNTSIHKKNKSEHVRLRIIFVSLSPSILDMLVLQPSGFLINQGNF